jgi:hypothetical protein
MTRQTTRELTKPASNGRKIRKQSVQFVASMRTIVASPIVSRRGRVGTEEGELLHAEVAAKHPVRGREEGIDGIE